MKVIVYARADGNYTVDDLRHLVQSLDDAKIEAVYNAPFANRIFTETGSCVAAYQSISEMADAAAVISYGGDGTFLETVALLQQHSLPIIGINSGRLGFLANVAKESVAPALQHLKKGEFRIEQRTVLHVEGDFGQPMDYRYAFNEFSIQKEGMNMIEVSVSVDGELIANYMADGVMISTPSGSTAYSMSVGGPIVSPACDCLLICPIAPHNLNMRPLVVESSGLYTLKVHTRNPLCLATLDNRVSRIADGSVFHVRRAQRTVQLIQLPETSFYETIRRKLLWGIDTRDKIK